MKKSSGHLSARFLQALLLALVYLWLIVCPRAASEAAMASLRLCAGVIVPSLFPFFVCSGLLCKLRLLAPAERALRSIMQPLFGLPGAGAAALLLGLTGGYPAGAQAAASLYEARAIKKQDAKQLLLFCNNCGPAFIFGVAAQRIFQSQFAGLLLYAAQILSAVFCGLLLAPEAPRSFKAEISASADASPAPPFSAAFSESVKKAGQTALSVCMFVVFFGVLSSLVRAALAPLLPSWALTIVCGLLELSGGMDALAAASFSQEAKFVLASCFLAFGGVSVLAQSGSVLQEAGLDGAGLLAAKVLQGALASLFAALLYLLFGARFEALPAFSPPSSSFSLALFCLLFPCAVFLIFRKMAGSIFRAHRV